MSDQLKENGSDNVKQIIKEEVIEPDIRLNTKPIPIIITLAGAAIASIISVIQFADFGLFFKRLLQSVIVFAIIGAVVKVVLDFIFNAKKAEEENEDEKETENIDKPEEDEKNPEEQLEEQSFEQPIEPPIDAPQEDILDDELIE